MPNDLFVETWSMHFNSFYFTFFYYRYSTSHAVVHSLRRWEPGRRVKTVAQTVFHVVLLAGLAEVVERQSPDDVFDIVSEIVEVVDILDHIVQCDHHFTVYRVHDDIRIVMRLVHHPLARGLEID